MASTPMAVAVAEAFLVPVHSILIVWLPETRGPEFQTLCWESVPEL